MGNAISIEAVIVGVVAALVLAGYNKQPPHVAYEDAGEAHQTPQDTVDPRDAHDPERLVKGFGGGASAPSAEYGSMQYLRDPAAIRMSVGAM